MDLHSYYFHLKKNKWRYEGHLILNSQERKFFDQMGVKSSNAVELSSEPGGITDFIMQHLHFGSKGTYVPSTKTRLVEYSSVDSAAYGINKGMYKWLSKQTIKFSDLLDGGFYLIGSKHQVVETKSQIDESVKQLFARYRHWFSQNN